MANLSGERSVQVLDRRPHRLPPPLRLAGVQPAQLIPQIDHVQERLDGRHPRTAPSSRTRSRAGGRASVSCWNPRRGMKKRLAAKAAPGECHKRQGGHAEANEDGEVGAPQQGGIGEEARCEHRPEGIEAPMHQHRDQEAAPSVIEDPRKHRGDSNTAEQEFADRDWIPADDLPRREETGAGASSPTAPPRIMGASQGAVPPLESRQ